MWSHLWASVSHNLGLKEDITDDTVSKFNNKEKVQTTVQKEQHNSINFLDLTIQHKRTKLEFTMY
jgi:hypothetical protein